MSQCGTDQDEIQAVVFADPLRTSDHLSGGLIPIEPQHLIWSKMLVTQINWFE